MKTVIPVRTLSPVVKSDEALKVLLLRCASTGRRSLSGVIAEQVVQTISGLLKDSEIKTLDAAKMVIASGAQSSWPSPYNDPESDLFVPQDEMPAIYEALVQCDVSIIATDTHWNFPNRHLVGIAERLESFKTGQDAGAVKIKNKIAAVIATSAHGGANLAGSSVAQMFSVLGFAVPGHCIITATEQGKEDYGTLAHAAGVALVDAALAVRRT